MWLPCGRFGRAHGVHGEIRLVPFNADTTLIAAGRTLQIGAGEGPERTVEIERVRQDARGPCVRIRGVADRGAAQALTGLVWFETREGFAPLEDDEHYVADLIGLPVYTEEGRGLGRIADVWSFGGADIIVVRDGGREHLIPFVSEFVTAVDPVADGVCVKVVPGLLDES